MGIQLQELAEIFSNTLILEAKAVVAVKILMAVIQIRNANALIILSFSSSNLHSISSIVLLYNSMV